MKMFKFNVLILLPVLFITTFLSACGSSRTSAMPSTSLQPVAVEGSKEQVMNMAFNTAKQVFPDDECERDDRAGMIKVHRGSFWSGNTLLTVNCEKKNENQWLVRAESQGVGFSRPIGNRTTAETEYYLNSFKYVYNQSLAAANPPKAEVAANKESPKEVIQEAAAPAEATAPVQAQTPPSAPEPQPPAVQGSPVTETAPAPVASAPAVEKAAPTAETKKIKVIGNSDSKRYHLPGMKYYKKVKAYHRVVFDSEEEAIQAGYHKARR